MNSVLRGAGILSALLLLHQPAAADAIADWNQRALALILQHQIGPPPAERVMAMMHLAMFDAVNSVERRYKSYLPDLPVISVASKEVAAAAAAGTVLAAVTPKPEDDVDAKLAEYLATIPESPEKTAGIALGKAVAAKMLAARAGDGSSTPESYRPKTEPGVYVPTPPVFVPHWPNVKPFVMTRSDQFRPPPPLALTSDEWAANYNEIKELGRVDSKKRSAKQTEDARFWITTSGNVYYPMVRAIAEAKKLNLLDSARLFALVAAARADGLIAVFDAKYHYNFWRPITAIRHGDNDGNATTERDATWRPIGDTPMHPEYPCAHCIQAASMCAVLEAVFGTPEVAEISMTSPSAPGTTHRWTNLRTFVAEVSEARIWAGFHYRFSTRIGEDMGNKIGQYVASNLLQPVSTASR